jgi:hypothetical protein
MGDGENPHRKRRNFARWGGWVDEVVESLVHRSSSGVGQIRMADFQAQMRLKARWGSGWGARNGRRKQWEVIPVRTRSGNRGIRKAHLVCR